MGFIIENAQDWSEETLIQRLKEHRTDESFVFYQIPKKQIDTFSTSISSKTEFKAISEPGLYSLSVKEAYLIEEGNRFSFDGIELQIHEDEQPSHKDVFHIQKLVNNYPDGSITLIDTKLNILYTAGDGYDKHGIDPKTLMNQPANKVLSPEVFNLVETYFGQVAPKKVLKFEVKFQDLYYENTLKAVFNQEGEVAYVVLRALDITEKVKVEQKLQKSQLDLVEKDNRFQGIAENLPGAIYLCKNDERYSMVYLNKGVERITGYSSDEFKRDNISFVDLYHPDDEAYVYEQVDKALSTKKPFHITYRLRKKDRSIIWVDEFGQGVYEGDKLTYIEGVILDITERKIVENNLKQSEANLKGIVESTTSIIGLFDVNKRLIEFNTPFKDYALRTEGIEIYHGMDLISVMRKEVGMELSASLERSLQGEKFVLDATFKSGDDIHYFTSYHNPVYQANKIIGVSLFVENIGELKKYQKQLEDYATELESTVNERTKELQEKNIALLKGNAKLEEALNDLKATQAQLVQSEKMASLGVLAAGVGHEINNPLNFIKNGYTALLENLEDEETYQPEDLKPYFDIIGQGVDRASKIISSLSHFSRQAKNMNEICDVHSILDNCLVILQNRLKNRIELVRNYDADGITLTGNEGKLHQSFLNVISNAEQAIQETGKIIITTKRESAYYIISIADNGEGIAEENLHKISDPFFTTKAPGKGTGLGLFITYSLIKEMRGTITVQTEEKKGTEFIIKFPKK